MVTESSSNILDDCDFMPFGVEQCVASSSWNTYKFTGKERDSESGNDYFGARYYENTIGRFLSPDPGPWILGNPQSFNAYNYSLDNPLRYADDGGETPKDRVNAALQFAAENIPYVWGGKNPLCGLDCSGLVQNVFKADPDNTIHILDTVQSAAMQAADLQKYGEYSKDIHQKALPMVLLRMRAACIPARDQEPAAHSNAGLQVQVILTDSTNLYTRNAEGKMAMAGELKRARASSTGTVQPATCWRKSRIITFGLFCPMLQNGKIMLVASKCCTPNRVSKRLCAEPKPSKRTNPSTRTL